MIQRKTLFFQALFLCIITFSSVLLSKKIIKAYIDATHPGGAHHLESLQNLISQLKNPNILFTKTIQEADIILADTPNDTILSQNIPIIICDPMDHTAIPSFVANNLDHENIIAVYKGFSIQPIELNNAPRCFDAYHYNLINRSIQISKETQSFQISQKNLNKIKCVPFSCWLNTLRPDFDQLKKLTIDYNENRPIDLFFAGNVTYDGLQKIAPLNWHREQAIKACNQIKGINKEIRAGSYPLTQDQYFQKIKESKIVISPWGYGEWCWRDFESMLSGAIIIKPESDFIVSKPANIYQKNITYMPCEIDFSNLKEKVLDILKNYKKYKKMRKKARSILLSWSHEKMATNFIKNVKNDLISHQKSKHHEGKNNTKRKK